MIRFACPTCASTCSVDDKLSGRKIKCPKCGARVIHVRGAEVRLLSAGVAPAAKPAAAAGPSAPASVPHSVTDFVKASESKQNLYIGVGLLLLFAAIFTILGIILNLKLLALIPITIVLVLAGIGLWLHTRKLRQRLEEKEKRDGTPPS
ncbi:MAG TPA: hypothetical protein VE981_13075 [Planctomycetota bacterium]|nr:hypothetical protein [Planctomycetota bacterium]